MKLIQVPHTHIDQAWRDGASSLSKACLRTDEVTGEQLKLMLARNEYQLLGAIDKDKPVGWAAVCVQQLPNLRALLVYAIHAPGTSAMFDQLKEYARFNGCTAIQGACDDAVSRLWARSGAKRKYQMMEWQV